MGQYVISNPKMQTSWYKIGFARSPKHIIANPNSLADRIARNEKQRQEEEFQIYRIHSADTWCADFAKARWTRRGLDPSKFRMVYAFKHRRDALLFQLKFNGIPYS